jgi:hypothetical protein
MNAPAAKGFVRLIGIGLLVWCAAAGARAQSRIDYNRQQLFLNGSNAAWVNFAGDLGPGALDTVKFRSMFDSLHAHGANSVRLWLHTNGTQTPVFDGTGKVTGPGPMATAYLRRILDMAWQRKIGMMLCLWSFDMQRLSIGSLSVNRNALMLNDTSYTNAYIAHALMPLVSSVKGHPAIIAWEIFNEAEGMTNEYGWSDIGHVPMASIQRFVNLTAGAIHRVDSAALVTTGAWALTVETDVNILAKQADVQTRLQAMTAAERRRVEQAFADRYGIAMSAEQILKPFSVAANSNYYRDDRLIALGGDPLGTLDFYTVHYYDWQGTSISPFHHPYSTWNLTKPLVIAEFFPEQTLELPYTTLYTLLYDNGYAGAMSWGWYAGATGHDQGMLQRNTMTLTGDLFSRFPDQIEVNPVTGTVYAFTASPEVLDKGESSVLEWKTALGTSVTVDGTPVPIRGTMTVVPETTTTYQLLTAGAAPETASVTVAVHPSGTIVDFTVPTTTIGAGDRVTMRWKVAAGSTATLNDSAVTLRDSLRVRPAATTTYTLIATGATRDTASVTITVVPLETFNRALLRPVTVAGSSTDPAFANPQNAVDGDTTTQWVSANVRTQFQSLVVDLGQEILVTRVIVQWGVVAATSHTLSLRSAGGTWRSVRSITGATGGIEVLDSLNEAGREVQLFLGRPGSSGFAVREFEVYGLQETSSVGNGDGVPLHFALFPNYPNPFNPSTTIMFTVPERSLVRVTITNVLGQQVTELTHGLVDPGVHAVVWSSRQASGVYFCRMTAEPAAHSGTLFVQTRRIVLLK